LVALVKTNGLLILDSQQQPTQDQEAVVLELPQVERFQAVAVDQVDMLKPILLALHLHIAMLLALVELVLPLEQTDLLAAMALQV
jgi:hypothetical protein